MKFFEAHLADANKKQIRFGKFHGATIPTVTHYELFSSEGSLFAFGMVLSRDWKEALPVAVSRSRSVLRSRNVPRRLDRCPLCPDSDRIAHRSEMSRWAKSGSDPYDCAGSVGHPEIDARSRAAGVLSHNSEVGEIRTRSPHPPRSQLEAPGDC